MRPTQVEVDPRVFVAWLVLVVVVFLLACYGDKGLVYEAVQKRLARWRAWRRQHLRYTVEVPVVGGTLPPRVLHPNCRCATIPDHVLAKALEAARPRVERDVADMVAAHFGGPERVERVPGGGYRHTYNLRDHLRTYEVLPGVNDRVDVYRSEPVQPYRPERRSRPRVEQPIRLSRERCRYCPVILPPEQLARHQRAHLN